MKKKLVAIIIIFCFIKINAQYSEPDFIKTSKGSILIQPVLHSSLILKKNKKTIYIDPYKELEI